MKSIRSRFLIAALAVVMGSIVAKAQTADAPPPPPMHGHEFGMGGHMMGFLAQKLNLTEDQKTQMKAIFQKEHPTVKPLMQQEHQIDQAKVQALAAQKAQIQAQLTVQETRIHNELYQLLTPDQQSQLKQMEAQHETRMQQRMNSNTDEPPAPPEQ